MFNGNLYGLIITMLTFVIAVVLTMRQVEQTGVHVEFIIRPVAVVTSGKEQKRGMSIDRAPAQKPERNVDGTQHSE